MAKLDESSAEIQDFLQAWHENGRAAFEGSYKNLCYDSETYRKHAHTRKKFVACDDGTSGYFLVDRDSHEVFSIKAYGVPNRSVGNLEALTAAYRRATAAGQGFPRAGYVDADRLLRLAAESGHIGLCPLMGILTIAAVLWLAWPHVAAMVAAALGGVR